MPKFIILMTENDNAWAALTQAEQDRLLSRYDAWVEELKTRDQLRGGEPIGKGGRTLHMTEGQLQERECSETTGVLTGFFIVEAVDLDAAVAIARGCPALTHGETVEVRPLGHM